MESKNIIRLPIPVPGAKEVTGQPGVPDGVRAQLPNGRMVPAGVGETYWGTPEVQFDENGKPVLVVDSILR